jgi:hypothetical protein
MPISFRLLMLPIALVAAPAVAQSPFDGTWKGDLASAAVQSKPNSYMIKDGVWRCASCIPAYSVPADGRSHQVAGKDYWDAVAVSVVDDRTVRFTYSKTGKTIAETTSTVSPDGATVTNVSRDANNGGNVPVESKSVVSRIGAPVAGAHALSGEWKPAPATQVSDAALTMTMKVENGMVHLKSGLGETLRAKIGGDYALNEGDPGKTMTKVEQPAPNVLKMTDMRGGKVVQVATYTVEGDRLTANWTDPRNGATGRFVANRQ